MIVPAAFHHVLCSLKGTSKANSPRWGAPRLGLLLDRAPSQGFASFTDFAVVSPGLSLLQICGKWAEIDRKKVNGVRQPFSWVVVQKIKPLLLDGDTRIGCSGFRGVRHTLETMPANQPPLLPEACQQQHYAVIHAGKNSKHLFYFIFQRKQRKMYAPFCLPTRRVFFEAVQ